MPPPPRSIHQSVFLNRPDPVWGLNRASSSPQVSSQLFSSRFLSPCLGEVMLELCLEFFKTLY